MANAENRIVRAGVGKADITCREQGRWGDILPDKVKKHVPPDYLAKRVEVSDPLFVRALVLDDGMKTIVLITMDVTAIAARTISQNILADSADDFMPRLRSRIADEFDIPGGHVNVSASHNHQVCRMLCDDQEQIERALEAIRQAHQNLVPVTIGVGSGHEDRLTVNRTMMMKDGSDYTLRSYAAPVPPDGDVDGLRPIDPEIGVIRIDRLDGRPLAVVYNFAAHLLLGAPDGTVGTITADHVGVTLRRLEEYLGGDAMAFFLQGALGDTVEVCQFDVGNPPTAEAFGSTLAQSVIKAYARIKPGSVNLAIVSHRVELPLRTDIPAVIDRLRRWQSETVASLRYTSLNFKAFLPLYLQYSLSPDYPAHWAYRYLHADSAGDKRFRLGDERNRAAIDTYLASIHKMEQLADSEERIATLQKHQEVIEELNQPSIPAEVQGIRIGDTVLVTAPMELLAETGLKIKQQSPFNHTFIVSLANGYLHYAPPASYYPRGGYEVTECLLAPEWENLFASVVAKILVELGATTAAL